jgi:hypothetical protein
MKHTSRPIGGKRKNEGRYTWNLPHYACMEITGMQRITTFLSTTDRIYDGCLVRL